MTTRTYTISGAIAGKSFSGVISRDGTTEVNGQAVLAAGVAGTLTTRTDNTTGVITLGTDVGATLSNGTLDYDVFWTLPAPGLHRSMTGVLTGDTIAVSLGSGDNLPPVGAAVVIQKQTSLVVDFFAAAAVMAMVAQQSRASVQFLHADGTLVHALDLGRFGRPNEPWAWASTLDVTTPFGADVATVAVSNGNSAGANLVTVAVLRA
jgi:hypothetical protein